MTDLNGSSDLAGSLARTELELRPAIALKRNRDLRLKVLRGKAGIISELPLRSGWLTLTPESFLVARELHADIRQFETLPFAEFLGDPLLSLEFDDTGEIERAHDEARSVVTNLFLEADWRYPQIVEWAPLIEASAYTVSTQAAAALDRMRRMVQEACLENRADSAQLAFGYRGIADGMGRTTLLAIDGGSSWLADMAHSFEWTRWTPSFPLSRERDLWAVMIGARAASRFGPSVIERYLGALRAARHPLYALDALIGLAAVGIRFPSVVKPLIRSLELDRSKVLERGVQRPEIVANGYAEALRALTETEGAGYPFPTQRKDAFNLDEAGRIPIFKNLKNAVECALPEFTFAYKVATPNEAKKMFLRTWSGVRPDLDSYPDSAFGRA